MNFSIKDFFSKCDQIHRKLRIRLHLLKKPFMENFIFCAVSVDSRPPVLTAITNTCFKNGSYKVEKYLHMGP